MLKKRSKTKKQNDLNKFDEELEWGKLKEFIAKAFECLPETSDDENEIGDEEIDYGV